MREDADRQEKRKLREWVDEMNTWAQKWPEAVQEVLPRQWHKIQGLRHDAQSIYLMVTETKYFHVPKSAFGNPSLANEFIKELKPIFQS